MCAACSLPARASEQGKVIGVGVHIYVRVPGKRAHVAQIMIFLYRRF